MKKLVMLLLCGGLLVACSQSGYDVKVSQPDDVLISGSNVNITKQDYFEKLLEQYGSKEVVNQALSAIADKEITDQKEIDKLVKENQETYAKFADGSLEKYAKNLGYDTKEAFIKEYLTPEAKKELLRKKYIQENMDSLIKDYQICSFKKIVVDKESEALKIIKESTSQEIFDKKLKDAGSKGEDAGIVTKDSTLDDNLKNKLEKLSAETKDGVYNEAIKLSDDTYAVVYLYNTDHKNTDELVKTLSTNTSVKEEAEGKYLKKYNFTVNDTKIQKEIEELSKQYIE